MSFNAEGSSDVSRDIFLADSSRAAFGVPEKDELGEFKGSIVGFIKKVDEKGVITETVQAFFQPRNWHQLEKGGIKGAIGGKIKDRRADVSLISDLQNEFAGFNDDKEPLSPFLNDWFWDGEKVNGSTRVVDYRDPKGRTALLAQALVVKDDHKQQYTLALNLGPEVGNHETAAAGYVYDNANDMMGRLSAVLTTNHADAEGRGRDDTDHGPAGIWHYAHVEMPGVDHGRFHISRDNCDKFEDFPAKSKGTGGFIDGFAIPGLSYFKAPFMWDHTVKGVDTPLKKETAQIRGVYTCVLAPEVPGRPNQPDDGPQDGDQGGGPTTINVTNVTNNSSIIIISIVINQNCGPCDGPTGKVTGGLVINPLDPGRPPIPIGDGPGTGEVVPFGPAPGSGVGQGAEDGINNDGFDGENPGGAFNPGVSTTPNAGLRAALGDNFGRASIPPPGGADGYVLQVPYASHPPLPQAITSPAAGYLAISQGPDGQRHVWVGGRTTAAAPSSVGGFWQELMGVPPGVPEGLSPVTNGRGGYVYQPPAKPPEPPAQQPVDLLFDVLGYDKAVGGQRLTDGYGWVPNPDDPSKTRLVRYENGEIADVVLDLSSGDVVVEKPSGTPDGYVPRSTELGTEWVSPSSSGANLGIFGDGHDGAADLDGTNTYSYLSKSGNVYTLTRDVYLTNLTVGAACTLYTNGFRVRGNGTLTNAGLLGWEGGDATSGSGASGAVSTGTSTIGAGGFNGGAGASAGMTAGLHVAVGSAGTSATSNENSDGDGGAGGGANDGLGSSAVGGAGGTANGIGASYGSIHSTPNASEGYVMSRNTSGPKYVVGGAGGGGGSVVVGPGTTSFSLYGGGGGGGGGIVLLAFHTIVNNGRISADGGDGADGNATGASGAGDTSAGGGGGGGGGFVLVTTRSYTGDNPTADGGAGGSGAFEGNGVDLQGSPGVDGTVVMLVG